MAVFRVERTGDYTVMSNFHLKDKRLSLKAKGLLSQMLSLPDDWDYTLSECQANLSAKVNTFPASCQGYQASVRIIADSVVFGYSRLVRTNQKP